MLGGIMPGDPIRIGSVVYLLGIASALTSSGFGITFKPGPE
jgi:hypothetical protein